MDSHQTTRFVNEAGQVRIEGRFLAGNHAFGISLRSLLPKRAECSNLVVPVCLSASNVAIGSIRMEPVYMVLGQAAGEVAALAAAKDCAVQDIPYSTLRPLLTKAGMILPSSEEAQTQITDDPSAAYVGPWKQVSDTQAMIGTSFHQLTVPTPDASAVFTVTIPKDGDYQLHLAYRPAPANSSNAQVIVTPKSTPVTKSVNLQKEPSNHVSISLASGHFSAQEKVQVIIKPGSDGGQLTVDAVLLLPKP